MATEKTLQQYVAKKFRAAGWLVYKFASPSYRGVPDLMLVAPDGWVMFIEVKHPDGTGRLSKLQHFEIAQLRAHNAEVHVVDSKEQANEILRSYRPRSGCLNFPAV
jgi:hypothetical protein